MKSPWHRDTHGASQALRFNALPRAAIESPMHGLTLQARWHPAPHAPAARSGTRRPGTSWLPRLAGLLAFCALATGIFVAGSDSCDAHESARAGNYSGSTLAPITAAGDDTASAGLHGSGCRHKRKAGRWAHAKRAAP